MRSPASGAGIHCSKLEPLNERARMHRAGLAFASMSQNNSTILYAGIDIAKDTLQFSLCGTSENLPNDARGHARILRLLSIAEAARPGVKVHAILEATGSYEAALCPCQRRAGQDRSHRRRCAHRLWRSHAAPAKARATSAEAAPPCAAPSTWPPLSAVRHDPVLRDFYARLRAPKAALGAATRKLIVLLNRMLKNPRFQIRSPPCK